MFGRGEAFDFVKNFLQIDNAESRMDSNRRNLLDEIIYSIHTKIPFQNLNLLSKPPEERRQPSQDEMKANYVSGIGGLCFDLNISTFHLLSALGFEVVLAHATITTNAAYVRSHVVLVGKNIEHKGDKYLLETAGGSPTFTAISLDFEKESPIYTDSYLEYKFVKQDGRLSRMHGKGDPMTGRGKPENADPEVEFWLDGETWRRFYWVELDTETKDLSKFDKHYNAIYVSPQASTFHYTLRAITFPEGKAAMIANGKSYVEIDGKLVVTEVEGGDEAIQSKIEEICPQIPRQSIPKSIQHWRQAQQARE